MSRSVILSPVDLRASDSVTKTLPVTQEMAVVTAA